MNPDDASLLPKGFISLCFIFGGYMVKNYPLAKVSTRPGKPRKITVPLENRKKY